MYSILVPGHDAPLPVGKIVGIGRNYARHAAEMGSEPPPEPMVFLKPSTALVGSGGTVMLPGLTREVHHEVELVAVIGDRARNVPADDALSHVSGYAVGLDITARDLQAAAKRAGQPWAAAKGLDSFAPLGGIVASKDVPDPQGLRLELRVNGGLRQIGSTADMIFPVAALVAYCSRLFTLEPGDLVYTGTPEGVGPVTDGDVLEARIDGFPELIVTVSRY